MKNFRLWFVCVALGAVALVRVGAQSPITVTQTVTLTPKLDVFRSASQNYALTGTPAMNTSVMVFLNGLLMLQGVDYTLTGNALTFTGQQVGADPIIQVMYWKAPQ